MTQKVYKIGLISSDFNRSITDLMRINGRKGLHQYLGHYEEIAYQVAGAVELPYAFQHLVKHHQVDGVLLLGCVIQGETDHYQYVCQMVSQGCMDVSLKYHIPMGFGVITAQNMDLAKARATTKPQESVSALVSLIKLYRNSYEKVSV